MMPYLNLPDSNKYQSHRIYTKFPIYKSDTGSHKAGIHQYHTHTIHWHIRSHNWSSLSRDNSLVRKLNIY